MLEKSDYRVIKWIFISLIPMGIFAVACNAATPAPATAPVIQTSRLALPFIANVGQVEQPIRYYGEFPGGKIYFTGDGQIIYRLTRSDKTKNVREFAIREQILGGHPPQIAGQAPAAVRINYFLGANPKRWHRDVPAFQYVNFGEIYEKIALIFEVRGNTVEKLFYVKPGGDPSRICIQLKGAETITLNQKGQLVAQTADGSLIFSAPVAYQLQNGKRTLVKTAFTLAGNQYGFRVAPYDPTRELIIDPLIAATFMGEFVVEPHSYNSMAMTTDASGNVFVVSTTFNDLLPGTANAHQKNLAGGYDMIITKYSYDLKMLLAATFLGGTETESVCAIAADASGNVFVAGTTDSDDFPLAADRTYNGKYDAVVAKLSNDLSSLQGVLLVGGSYTEYAHAMALDESGTPYITGYTFSADFPVTPGAYEYEKSGQSEVFVTQLNASLSGIAASTVFGGPEHDSGEAITIAPGASHVYIAGMAGYMFPTKNGYRSSIQSGDRDAMVVMLTANLSSLVASTYIGGSGMDGALSIAFRGGESLYVSGITQSKDIWNKGTRKASGYSLFVSEVNPQLNSVITMLYEGSADHWPTGLTIDKDDYVYLTGYTTSNDFPTTEDAYDPSFNGNKDGFILKLDENIMTIIACTYWGGDEDDLPHDVILDKWGNIYITGVTLSDDLPITFNAYHKTFFGYAGYTSNGFVTHFSPDLSRRVQDGPKIIVLPDLYFGKVKIGDTKGMDVIITNFGNQDLIISSIAIEGRDRDEFTITPVCSAAIIPRGDSCIFSMKFEPLLDTGSLANLSIISNDTVRSPFIVPIKGLGISGSHKTPMPAIVNLLLGGP